MKAVTTALALALLQCAVTQLPAQETRTIDLGGGVSLELVRIPKGEFTQGSPLSEANRNRDEFSRRVTISRDFFLGKYPVTVGQFKRFVAETGYRTEAEKGQSGGFGWDGSKLVQRKDFTWRNPGFPQTDDHPVTIVTYDDARSFLQWLSRKASLNCDLPTEAMWEYACRAGTSTPWPGITNEKQLADIAWFKGNAGQGTQPVGKKKANAFGVYDMCGNVYEWCRDWYGPYSSGAITDPFAGTSPSGETPRRVLRGGSWLKDAAGCRSAARFRNAPGSRNADNGFRVMALEAAAQAKPEPGVPQPAPRLTAPTPKTQPQRPAEIPPVAFPSPVEPSPRETSSSGWPLLTVCVCFGVPLLVIAGVVLLIVRRVSRFGSGGATSSGPPPVAPPRTAPTPQTSIRIADDGFWVEGPSIRSGMALRYRCRAGGSEQQGDIAITSTSQFVYTGDRPSEIEILEIRPGPARPTSGTTYRTGPSITTSRRPPPPPLPTPPPQRLTDDDRPSPGYPSAY